MNFFDFIPGFRSNTLWKEIIAILYYILSIYYFIHTWGAIVFLLSFPFAFFSFIDILKANIAGISVGNIKYIFLISIILMIVSGFGVFHSFFNVGIFKKRSKINLANTKSGKDILRIHFLNVGQGDSILIEQSGKNMLIDGGYRINSRSIIKYLKKIGIKKLDYIIATHPHPDHIGGFPKILKNMSVENVVLLKPNPFSKERYQKKHNDFLNMIQEKNINIIHPDLEKIIRLGESYLEILAPNGGEYKRVNNYSIVTKLVYGDTSFLFTGDAETYSESEMIKNGFNVKADVLKVGHHGSCTSSSRQFLKVVSPKYAIISVGFHSFYGQPDKCVLDRLKEVGAKLYRTDKLGTIVVESDGEELSFNVESCQYPKSSISYISMREKYRVLHKRSNIN